MKEKKILFVGSHGSHPSFHMAFAISKTMIKSVDLHISFLPTPPKNYREMLEHEYAVDFKVMQEKEINKLIEMEVVKFIKMIGSRDIKAILNKILISR